MGAAIVRPPNTEYKQSMGACWEKLPKKVKITLLQFNNGKTYTSSPRYWYTSIGQY